MVIEEETEAPAKPIYQQRVQVCFDNPFSPISSVKILKNKSFLHKNLNLKCLDCHCIGVLNQKKGKVYLFPEEVLSTRSINTKQHHLEKKKTWKKKVTAKLKNSDHGFSTMSQKNTYVVLGSIFWITIMLVGKYFLPEIVV